MYELHKGDCLKYIRTLKNKSDFAIVTDPPYGINYVPSWKKWNGGKSNFKKIHGDDKPFSPKHLLKFNHVVLFGANFYSNLLPVGSWLVWDKRTNVRLDRMFGVNIEMAWMKAEKPSTEIIRILHGGVVNADSQNGNNEKRVHPTQKPISLFYKIIEQYIPKELTVLDPYMGSGTTGVACVQLGRNFIGVEIDENYFDIAERRIHDASQQGLLFSHNKANAAEQNPPRQVSWLN